MFFSFLNISTTNRALVYKMHYFEQNEFARHGYCAINYWKIMYIEVLEAAHILWTKIIILIIINETNYYSK